jgi:hypothetical protein
MDKCNSFFLAEHKDMVGAAIHKKQRGGSLILPLVTIK